MKLARVLTLQGYALSGTEGFAWLGFGLVSLFIAILISAMTRADTLDWLGHAAYGWAGLNALLWVFLANAVPLARDARALRMPALQRDALISLGLYGGAGIVLPTLLLGYAGGHWLTVAIVLLFGAGLGAAYALLSSYLMVLVFFAAYLPAAVSPWLPQPMQPGFNAWAGPLVGLLWLALGWRMLALIRGEQSLQPVHGTMLLGFRRNIWGWGSGANAEDPCSRMLRRGPAWARPRIDLHGCGPGHAEQTLRMALGGWWTPQTWLSRVWQWILQLGGILVGVLVVLALVATHHHDHAASLLTDIGGARNVVFFGTLMSASLAIKTVRSLYQRWRKTNVELPLLALLPGLGDASATKHALLRASLLPALGVQAALAMALLFIAIFMHLGAEADAVLLLGPLGSSALMCAFALVVFGGVPMHGWGMTLAMGAGYMWVGTSGSIVELGAGAPAVLTDVSLLIFALGWSGLFIALWWLSRRGWCALHQRPHAFLVN